MARPIKVKPFIIEAEKFLSEPENENVAIIFTDNELLDAINERLPEEDRISPRTFELWKAKSLSNTKLDETGTMFLRLIKKTLREQKQNIFRKMAQDDKAWTRWAWIIERKFDEWNIRTKVENQIELKQPDYSRLSAEKRRELLTLLREANNE